MPPGSSGIGRLEIGWNRLGRGDERHIDRKRDDDHADDQDEMRQQAPDRRFSTIRACLVPSLRAQAKQSRAA
jgi:hypothetical protein